MSVREAFAALDLGTSRLRVGVFEDGSDGDPLQLRVIGDHANEVKLLPYGHALCSFKQQWTVIHALLTKLRDWASVRKIERLHLGVCGQVSSLLRWDDVKDEPLSDEYPIWMDSTCRDALADMTEFWGNGGAQRMLGTCMPAVTTWLAVKARDHVQKNPADCAAVLQIQDAVFRRLTGQRLSHPSSQISLVNQDSYEYSADVLKFVGLAPERLPTLAPRGSAPLKASFIGFPETLVYAGLMDTHAAFYGLMPSDGDGLLLTGTSEVLGVFEKTPRAQPPARMVRARLGDGWIVYGSSTSGGGSVRWLVENVFGSTMLSASSIFAEADSLPPGADGLFCLPYFAGERAPLWNSELTGSFVGLRTHHRQAHLLRALLEGIAFARRQAAEALERPMPQRILIAGGSASNALWNRIRASVLERPLDVMECGDVALLGCIRHAMEIAGADPAPLRKSLTCARVEPEGQWVASYERLYQQFLALQKERET